MAGWLGRSGTDAVTEGATGFVTVKVDRGPEPEVAKPGKPSLVEADSSEEDA